MNLISSLIQRTEFHPDLYTRKYSHSPAAMAEGTR